MAVFLMFIYLLPYLIGAAFGVWVIVTMIKLFFQGFKEEKKRQEENQNNN